VTWAPLIGSLLARPERAAIGADERALLDAVIAEPDADGPRLVYADWLQHYGDVVRGELIAVQCALARLDNIAEHNRLKTRDFELVEHHGNTWCAEVGIGDVRNNWHPSVWAADFQRGFIEAIEMPAHAFASVVPPLFALEPVRELRLIGVSGHSDTLNRLPESIYLRRLRSFGLRNTHVSDDVLALIVSSPMFTKLERLQIEDQDLGRLSLDALGRTAIRELTLRTPELDLAVHVLARSPLVAQLEVLALDGPIGNAAAHTLAVAETQLRRLSVGAISEVAHAELAARFGDALVPT
jgi:uncharacterized protein (TIGR02996 family)